MSQEQVNHPPHYGGANNQYEAIKVIEAWQLDFCLGNVVKYISRAGKKDDMLQDLKKAKWYIDRKIYQIEPTKSESETISFDSLIEQLDNLIMECAILETDHYKKGYAEGEIYQNAQKLAYMNAKELLLNS
jgi:hypothetical protein